MNEKTSKKQALEVLQELRKSFNKPQQWYLANALDVALADFSKCSSCRGKGLIYLDYKPNDNYTIKQLKNFTYYGVKCVPCHGTGKQLDTLCYTCGNRADIMPNQENFNYCYNCENLHRKNKFII